MWSPLVVCFLLIIGLSCSTGCLETLKPCFVTDIECLSKNTQKFLDCTYGGMPKLDIKQIDPFDFPTLDVTPKDIKVTFHFKDLNVTGFRNQKVTYFTLDKETNEINLKTQVDVVFEGNVVFELHKPAKSYSGTVKAEGKVEGQALYVYNVKTDDKGVEHYEVGPETISCEAIEKPEFILDKEVLTKLTNDADFAAENENYKKVKEATGKEIICDVAKKGFAITVHNVRASARVIPKSAYFKDV